MENNISVELYNFLQEHTTRVSKATLYLPSNFRNKHYNLYLAAFLNCCAVPIKDTLENYVPLSLFNQIKELFIQKEIYNEKQFQQDIKELNDLGVMSYATAESLETEEDGYAFNFLNGKRFFKMNYETLYRLLAETVWYPTLFSLLCIFYADWEAYLYRGNPTDYPFYTYKTLLEKIGYPTKATPAIIKNLAQDLNFIFEYKYAIPEFTQKRFARNLPPFDVMRITVLHLDHTILNTLNYKSKIAQLLKLSDCEVNTNV